MPTQIRTELKSYFNTGDRPTESQFADLIDSSIHKTEDLASVAEIQAGTNNTKFVTPAGAKAAVAQFAPGASETVRGQIEIATVAEAQAGTDTTRAITPAGAKASVLQFAPVKTVNSIVPNAAGNVTIPVDDTVWTNVTVFNTTNAITSFDASNTVRCRRKSGIVFLDGKVKGGTAQTSNATYHLFTLPTGYFPSRRMSFCVFKADTTSSFSIGRIDIETNGMVYGVLYSPVYTNLTGISFPIG